MTNKTIAQVSYVSFWVFAATTVLYHVLSGLILISPPTILAVAMQVAYIIYVLGVIAWISLLVLLYSLASMLGVFGDTAK